MLTLVKISKFTFVPMPQKNGIIKYRVYHRFNTADLYIGGFEVENISFICSKGYRGWLFTRGKLLLEDYLENLHQWRIATFGYDFDQLYKRK